MKRGFYFILFFVFIASMMITTAGFAQESNAAPVDISADTALEWDRGKARYIARGNARAVQGDTTVLAETLTAYYNPDNGGATALTEIHADDGVQIINGDAVIFGDHAVYDLADETARVTGEALKLVSNGMTVTADKYFKYDAQTQNIIAYGNAVVREGERVLKTEKLIAYLIKNKAGEMVVDRLEAPGKVTITTQEETATGDHGEYDVQKDVAVLSGNVKIMQGKNILLGEKARVDMKTGHSRLFAAENEQGLPGRVRGVFYPESKEETP